MTEDIVFLDIEASDFEVRARPRIDGLNRRRPDFSVSSFQDAIIRSFVDRPDEPIEFSAVSASVPNDDCLPLVTTLKAILDAAQKARVINNDRNVLAARIHRFEVVGRALPTVNVEVLPQSSGIPAFERSFVQPTGRRVSRPVASATPYRYRSGVPGRSTFINEWVEDPADYERQLREVWQQLHEGSLAQIDDRWTQLPLPARLDVHLPLLRTEDPDNAMLYVVDMLEVARRDLLGTDAGDRTLDELLIEASFIRDRQSGIRVVLKSVDPLDQYTSVPYYLMHEGEPIDPLDPNAV
ncbi:MAG: hypothetical protein PF636_05645 [Actinomycetota bacterium]|jgi:hypothetical protein|nr:hypothetical protein [Actinomycetota bacterium]